MKESQYTVRDPTEVLRSLSTPVGEGWTAGVKGAFLKEVPHPQSPKLTHKGQAGVNQVRKRAVCAKTECPWRSALWFRIKGLPASGCLFGHLTLRSVERYCLAVVLQYQEPQGAKLPSAGLSAHILTAFILAGSREEKAHGRWGPVSQSQSWPHRL